MLARGATGPVASNGSPLYVVRHRFFDDILTELVESSSTRQVVLIAAGLDTRAFRLNWPDATRVFEIDQPSVFAYKDAILAAEGALPRADRRVVPADLREDWPEALLSREFDPARPTAWLAEGLLFYLPEPAVHRLLDDTYRLSASGSWFAADMIGVSPGPPQEVKDLFASLGAPFLFATEDMAGLLRSHNWDAAEIRLDEVARRVGTELPAMGGRVVIARRP